MTNMKATAFAVALLMLGLATGATAARPLSRGDQMKACAAQWKAQGHKPSGVKYQHFIGECLRKMSRT